jgi:hypothetical protein
MINRRELAALQIIVQIIAVAVTFFTASSPDIRQFLSHVFPYGGIIIPAGTFLLFQASFFIYTRYLWKLHPHTKYLGGQWIYKTNAKQTDSDPASLDVHSKSFYGVFEVIHTTDKLLVNHGEAWYCNEVPSFENKQAIWESDAIIYRDEKLWIVASVTGNGTSRSRLTQLAVLTVSRRGSQIKMEGIIGGVADPDGEYAYGFTEMRRISKCPREDAAQEAYRKYGSS